MANPRVVVDFVANTTGLTRGAAQAGGATSGLGSRLKSMGKTAALAAGTAGLGALVATAKVGAEEFAESQRVMAQTNAVLKSTGGVANVTAKEVSSLAESLMEKSGVDDEAIASGENLLLTFTNIRNEAGKGNDIFNQATGVMLDMSVALGQDMKTSAIQVGKALNNPIKGMTALTRVGVSFTDGQKKAITRMQESGNVMGAQKIILKELNKEFGGSAEAAGKTLSGQLNILKEEFNNLAGTVAGEVIPVLVTLAKMFFKHKAVVLITVGALAALGAAWVAVKVGVASYNAVLAIHTGLTAASAAATKGNALATAVYGARIAVVKAATVAWTAVQWLLNAALLANPIALVVVAIAALVAAFVIAYKSSDKFRALVDKAFKVVLNAAKAVFNWLKSNWPLIVGILTGPIGMVVVMTIRHWGRIKQVISDTVRAVKAAIVSAWNSIRSATSSAWSAVKNAVSGAIGAVKSLMRGLVDWISSLGRGILAAALGRVGSMFSRITDGARGAYNAVKNVLGDMVNFIHRIAGQVSNAASKVASALKGPLNAVIGAWNSLGIPRVSINIPSAKVLGKKIGGGSFGFGPIPFPDIPRLARGGVVAGPTLAMVGEGPGREIVAPESLLREIAGDKPVNVRVFIGDQELRGLVKTVVDDSNTGLARTLLAGGAR